MQNQKLIRTLAESLDVALHYVDEQHWPKTDQGMDMAEAQRAVTKAYKLLNSKFNTDADVSEVQEFSRLPVGYKRVHRGTVRIGDIVQLADHLFQPVCGYIGEDVAYESALGTKFYRKTKS